MSPKEEFRENPENGKRFLTLFILFFPTLIIAALPGTSFLMIGLKVLLVFYQFVIINNFISSHFNN